jgi:crotonobetainyl-CoA:carnitine CoA-transferase CaiB-like acyl-CoA transferase
MFHPRRDKACGPAPRLGEHTEGALQDWLGMMDSDIETLRSEGILT